MIASMGVAEILTLPPALRIGPMAPLCCKFCGVPWKKTSATRGVPRLDFRNYSTVLLEHVLSGGAST